MLAERLAAGFRRRLKRGDFPFQPRLHLLLELGLALIGIAGGILKDARRVRS